VPSATDPTAEEHVVGLLGGLPDDQRREVAVGGFGHEGGNGELEHDGLLGRRRRQTTER
jgi:hypothetical protein